MTVPKTTNYVKLAPPFLYILDMKNIYLYLALVLSIFSLSTNAQEASTEKKPYNLVVWADLSFDETSQLTQILIPEKDSLPKPFVTFLMTSVASGSFTKPENAGTNKQLESGLKLLVEIDPATAKAKVLSQDLMPRPIRVEHQSEPLIRVKGDWSGRILVTCVISEKGRCSKPKIDPTANAPAEISKVMLATLGSWRFLPQKRAGKAIEGIFTTWVTIEANTSAPPKAFGKQI